MRDRAEEMAEHLESAARYNDPFTPGQAAEVVRALIAERDELRQTTRKAVAAIDDLVGVLDGQGAPEGKVEGEVECPHGKT